MMNYLKRSTAARALLFAAIFVAIVTISFYAGVRREGGTVSLVIPTTETYASEALGIAFEYRSDIGPLIEEVHERGECDEGLLTGADQCEHRYIGVRREGSMRWFLSAESALFSQFPLPREKRYEDTLTEDQIEEFCTRGPLPISCAKLTNEHGLNYVRVGYSPACNGFEVCGDQTFFLNFIETKNPAYPVIVVWYDRSGVAEIADEQIDQIISTMRPRY